MRDLVLASSPLVGVLYFLANQDQLIPILKLTDRRRPIRGVRRS